MRYKILGSDVLDTQTNLVWRSPTDVKCLVKQGIYQ